MSFAEIFAKRDEYCVWIDWKTGADEALLELREHFGEKHTFLYDEKLDAMAENYGGEAPQDQMLALGQQCTVYDTALYNLDRGSDEYGLLLVAKDDMEGFEAYAKENDEIVEQLKQPRKRFGSIAKKIKLADKLTYAKFKLPGHSYIDFAGNFAANQIRHYGAGGGFSHKTSVCYDLSVWPPKKHAFKDIINYVGYSPEHEIWAAVFGEDSLNSSLRISKTPFVKNSWVEIPFPEKPDLAKWESDPAYKYYQGDVLDTLTYPLWVGPDLLLAYTRRHKPGSFASVTHVWAVPNAANGGAECRKVMVTPPCELERGEFPSLAFTQSGAYVLLAGRFYTWNGEKLDDTGIKALTHTEFDSVPTGPHTFAYVAEGRLVEVDMYRCRSRFRELKHMDYKASVHKLDADWAVLLRYGYVNSALDVAQFWNIKTDEWLRLKLGAFGNEGVRNLMRLENGAFLAETFIELCKIDDLLGFLAGKSDAALEMPPWNEDWSRRNQEAESGAASETAAAPKSGFWNRLKALFSRN